MIVEAADEIAFSARANVPRSGETSDGSPEAKWWRECLHRSENFKRDVAALLAPGGSAIFMLLRADTVPYALRQLRNYGDTIVHTSLSTDQDETMFALLAHG